MKKDERLYLRIDENLKERLKDAASVTERKPSEFVREAVLEKVKEIETANEKEQELQPA